MGGNAHTSSSIAPPVLKRRYPSSRRPEAGSPSSHASVRRDSSPSPASSSAAREGAPCGYRRAHWGRVPHGLTGVLCNPGGSLTLHPRSSEPWRETRDRSFPPCEFPMLRIAARTAFSLIGRAVLRAPGKTYRPRQVSGCSSRNMTQLTRAHEDQWSETPDTVASPAWLRFRRLADSAHVTS